MPWAKIAWFGVLVGVCYGPIMSALIKQWGNDEDMGHGFFVPVIAGYIIWQRREELLAMTPKPDWRGLMLVIFARAADDGGGFGSGAVYLPHGDRDYPDRSGVDAGRHRDSEEAGISRCFCCFS